MKTMIQYAIVLLSISAVACAILAVVNHQTAPLIAENKVKAEDLARKELFPDAVTKLIDEEITLIGKAYYSDMSDDLPLESDTVKYSDITTTSYVVPDETSDENGYIRIIEMGDKTYRIPIKYYDPTFVYYEANDDNGTLLGYIINAEGKGYSSTIKAMVAVSVDYTIQKVKILEQQETPGLGTNCEKPEFLQRFIGKKYENYAAGFSLKVDKDGGNIQSISGATITSRAVTKAIREAMDKLIAKTYVQALDIPVEEEYIYPGYGQDRR